jgi:hypothetical protein
MEIALAENAAMGKAAQLRSRIGLLVLLLVSLSGAPHALAREVKPKFGPYAIPIERATGYLRSHRATDYWALSPFYLPQSTDSDCSVASVAMLLNAIRGVPKRADQDIITEHALLAADHDARWTAETAEHGSGVTFTELKAAIGLSLRKFGLKDFAVKAFKPAGASRANLLQLRRILANDERAERRIALVYFNQGVLTGDWNGPHVSPIGAYDAGADRALIMDVDRRFYVPYWSPVTKLLQSMLKPAPQKFGALAGKTGGIVWVEPRRE